MKKRHLLFGFTFLLQLFFSSTTNGQTLVSNKLDGKVFIGPGNCLSTNNISQYNIDNLKNAKVELEKLFSKEDSLKIAIESKKRIKKKDQITLSTIEENKKEIGLEISTINELIRNWSKISDYQNSLLEAYTQIEKGKCLLIHTESGSYHSNEVIIKETGKSDYYEEFLIINSIEKGKKWEKVKKEDCLSKNEKDCFLWCLVDSTILVYYDRNNIKHEIDGCPNGMEFNAETMTCTKRIKIESDEFESMYELTLKNGGTVLEAINFEEIECERE